MAEAPPTQSRRNNMAAIRSRDTNPEMTVRSTLHAAGWRYRLHAPHLPGRPDLTFPRYRTAVFVHGCFWHAHDCRYFKWPQARAEFWKQKLTANVERDRTVRSDLLGQDWRVVTIWECALRSGNWQPEDIPAFFDMWRGWMSGTFRSADLSMYGVTFCK